MSAKYPSTIYNPEKFQQKLPAGYDGAFDWTWTAGCFGNTKIEPMDFDGVVERCGNFLLFETKEAGKEIPEGQRITLETAFNTGVFTIICVWGKRSPEVIEVWHPEITARPRYNGVDAARRVVSRWFEWANERRRSGKIDPTFLNRRVLALQKEHDQMTEQVRQAVSLLVAALQHPKDGGGKA
jgi:hypothetical protein